MGCSTPSLARPSIVVTLAPSQAAASTVHDFTALPSRCTTQAPHWLVSQPTCVPVSRKFSRRNCTSSVLGSMSAPAALPFTVMATLALDVPRAGCGADAPVPAAGASDLRNQDMWPPPLAVRDDRDACAFCLV